MQGWLFRAIPHWGWSSPLWVDIALHDGSTRYLFCAVCDTASRLDHPSSLCAALLSLCKGFSRSKQNSPLIQIYLEWASSKGKHLHTASAQGPLRRPLAHLPYVSEISRWEKGKGGFTEETHIGVCLLLWSRHCFAWRKLPDDWLYRVWHSLQVLIAWVYCVLLGPTCEKKAFSGQKRHILSGEHFLECVTI